MDRPYILLSDGDTSSPGPNAPGLQSPGLMLQVSRLHQQLRERLRWQKEGSEGILMQMLNIKCVLYDKCMELNVNKLMSDNAQVSGGLQSLQKCFGILCKYAQNLLLSPERRPANWRNVNFSNPVFAKCVTFIKGSEDVLTSLGYTMSNREGLAFPQNCEPDIERVAYVTADLKILYAEICSYCMGQHPNRTYFEVVIPSHWHLTQGQMHSQVQSQHTSVQGQVHQQGDQEEEEFHDARENLAADSKDCDICGSESAVTKCPSCDGKQLCRSCDQTWHSHPRRITHNRLTLDTFGHWKSPSNTGTKPKVPSKRKIPPGNPVQPSKPKIPPGNPVHRVSDPSQNVAYSVGHDFPKFPVVQESVPNLSIFNETRPVVPPSMLGFNVMPTTTNGRLIVSREDESPSSEYRPKKDSLNLRDSQSGTLMYQKKGRELLAEIKSIPSKGDHISRIKQELGNIDIRSSQCEQELNIILKDDDFEENPEYTRLSRQRDHLNRNKILLEEYWKELECEKHENKTATLNTDIVSEHEDKNLPGGIKYPPDSVYKPRTSAFDFERDMEIPTKLCSPVQQQEVMTKGVTDETVLHQNLNRDYAETFQQKGSGTSSKVTNRVPSQPISWICDHCTFHNDMNSKKCDVCREISEQPSLVFEDKGDDKASKFEQKPSIVEGGLTQVEAKAEVRDDTSSNRDTTKEYKSMFVEVQDDIFREKQKARERFQEMMMMEEQNKNGGGRGQFNEEDEDKLFVKRPPTVVVHPTVDNKGQHNDVQIDEFEHVSHLQLKLDLSKAQDLGSGSAGGMLMMNQATGTRQGLPQVKQKTTPLNQELTPPEGESMDMKTKLEQIQWMKEQEEANISSKEIIRMLRKAETEGYSMKEMEIALDQSEFPDPFYWIEAVWHDRVKAVVKKANDELSKDQVLGMLTNPITMEKARIALQKSEGQIEEAVQSVKTEWESAFTELNSLGGEFTSEEITKMLQDNHCDIVATEEALCQQFFNVFERKVWCEEGEVNFNGSLVMEDLGAVLEQKVRNKDLQQEHRIRMVLCEFANDVKSWGRASNVVHLLEEMSADVTMVDVIEAVRQCGNKEQASNYLQQECSMCFSVYPASNILSLTICQCKVCRECMQEYFEVQIKERHVKNLCCPACQMPEDVESEEAQNHLQFLHNFLQPLVSPDVFHVFEDKIRDWHLMKDPNFRWCSSHNCENGFIFNPERNRLKMRCDRCYHYTCFRCKKPWADQHENVTCEQFKAWQEANNPEFQEAGLAKLLQENGIDCPKCKMRYCLAKGGCMHFKCTQCGHEFCCGCNRPFLHRGACKELRSCESQGLHCHHPRDCLYYLRDSNVEQLQQLLRDNNVEFSAENPEQGGQCQVMEQKETQAGLIDEPCGKDVEPNQSGICNIHYKEYLVTQINAHIIDPVTHMDLNDIQTLYRRKEKEVPQKQQEESDTQYKQRLVNDVKLNFKLDRMVPVL